MNNPQKARWARLLHWVAGILVVAALILLVRALPVDALLSGLKSWIQSLGLWGPAAFILVYGVWTVAFLPGGALTLVGGALFGLWPGLPTVLTGATLGAALSFLVARYAARGRVERLTRTNPRLRALDRAVGEGGWKIVALLRLSPAMPFNLQNYLYGTTSIGFWTCILTSAVFMIPGTALYVYLGYIGAQGLAAASGGGQRSAAEWALLAVGLAATAAVTIYISRIATRALRQGAVESAETAPAEGKKAPPSTKAAAIGAIVSAAFFGVALYVSTHPRLFSALFGPPQAILAEEHERRPGGPTFDHSALDALLSEFVDERGLVDYRGLAQQSERLDQYLASVAAAPFEELGRDEKLALLINAYNAATLRLILDHYPLESIHDIPSSKRWQAERWTIGGETYSLDQIEHQQIRPKFAEPRIHFAVNCAALGCPPLRDEAYVGERIDAQLEDQARYVHNHDRWFRYEPGSGRVGLTKLYDWYGGDFRQIAGSILQFAGRYSEPLRKALEDDEKPKIDWLDYDWALNEQGAL